MNNLSEEVMTHQFFRLPIGEHWKKSRQRPRKGRLPNRQCHMALDLVQRRDGQCSHGQRLGGLVGRHLTKAQRPSPERHDPWAWY
jgi:hypothetical protein